MIVLVESFFELYKLLLMLLLLSVVDLNGEAANALDSLSGGRGVHPPKQNCCNTPDLHVASCPVEREREQRSRSNLLYDTLLLDPLNLSRRCEAGVQWICDARDIREGLGRLVGSGSNACGFEFYFDIQT